jgi:hypothetical protein
MYFVIDPVKRKVVSQGFELRDNAQKELVALMNKYRKENKVCNLQVVEHDSPEDLEEEMSIY